MCLLLPLALLLPLLPTASAAVELSIVRAFAFGATGAVGSIDPGLFGQAVTDPGVIEVFVTVVATIPGLCTLELGGSSSRKGWRGARRARRFGSPSFPSPLAVSCSGLTSFCSRR